MRMVFSVFIVFLLIVCGSTIFFFDCTATIAPGGDLPGGGYSIATNSFPVNTTVEVVNLENGKIVRATVISGLNTMGLMATLSREAANAIDLFGNSSCRIRMSQSTHEISISQLKLGPVVNPAISVPLMSESSEGESGIDTSNTFNFTEPTHTAPLATVDPIIDNIPDFMLSIDDVAPSTIVNQDSNVVNEIAETEAETADSYTFIASSGLTSEDVTPEIKDSDTIIAENGDTLIASSDSIIASGDSTTSIYYDSIFIPSSDSPANGQNGTIPTYDASLAAVEAAKTGELPGMKTITGVITLYPSEERTPEVSYRVISPEYLAPPLGSVEYVPPADFSPFQVPLISQLERGKYYVQVAAYARPDNVEDEINRIGKSFPLAIQNIGTDSNPLFRVLLGPLNNQSESSALLQRFRSMGYTDAFVWRN